LRKHYTISIPDDITKTLTLILYSLATSINTRRNSNTAYQNRKTLALILLQTTKITKTLHHLNTSQHYKNTTPSQYLPTQILFNSSQHKYCSIPPNTNTVQYLPTQNTTLFSTWQHYKTTTTLNTFLHQENTTLCLNTSQHTKPLHSLNTLQKH
jgi:hypothetical protein